MTETCTIEGCGWPLYARGYCQAHYTRLYRGFAVHRPIRRPFSATPADVICVVPGCGRHRMTRGYCAAHHKRLVTHGDVMSHVPIGALPGAVRSRDHIEPMPCHLSSDDYQAIRQLPTATMATYERRMALAAAERAAWEPDAAYLAAVAAWRGDEFAEAAD